MDDRDLFRQARRLTERPRDNHRRESAGRLESVAAVLQHAEQRVRVRTVTSSTTDAVLCMVRVVARNKR